MSKSAPSGGNGTSWSSAWNELSAINWSSVQSGDTVFLDGGTTSCGSNYTFSGTRPGVSCGMTYTTTLTPTRSNVTIQRSTEAGRNGTVVIYGGRPTPLPYCHQGSYSAGGTAISALVNIGSVSGVVIDGVSRSGIMGYGAQAGILFSSTSATNATIRNVELFDNGIPTSISGGYNSDGENVTLRGTGHVFDRVLVHDGGQDNFQSASNGTSGLTWKNSWLYFNRENPLYPGYTYNEPQSTGCTHADQIQLYSGGTQSGLTIDHVVFGPGANQGLYPSDGSSSLMTKYDNVHVSNTLFLAAHSHNVISDLSVQGWTMDHVTLFAPNGGSEMPADGSMTLTNTIKFGGYWYAPGGSWSASGNDWYNGDPIPGSINTNPGFVGPVPSGSTPAFSQLLAANFTPTCSACSGKGSPFAKATDILAWIDSLNA